MLYFYVASPEEMKGGVEAEAFDESRLYRSLDLANADKRGRVYVVDARQIPATLSGDVEGIPKSAILNRKPFRKPKEMTAGGGVVTRMGKKKLKVLLIYRKGRWDIAKGKLDKGESIKECAKREVMEELGIDNVKVHSFLDTTIHGYPEKDRFIVKTTHWYHMTTSADEFVPQKSERITRVKWFSLQKAKDNLGHENLIRLLNRVEHKLLVTHP
jgi:8-oxo-dGTP pyrophosphatase MutT (NUDIX family)